jgi:hypothetical protein
LKPVAVVLVILLAISILPQRKVSPSENSMNKIAESYVKLVLNTGQIDDGYVEAYYGPDEWKPKELTETEKKNFPLKELKKEAENLLEKLEKVKDEQTSELEKLRWNYLFAQIKSVAARIEMLGGKKMSFDEESEALYNAKAPRHNKEYFENIRRKLDSLLPGDKNITEKLESFRQNFIIPKDKIGPVFKAAIAEGRKRTLKHIELPAGENFSVEYVTNKPWSAYNWYKGNAYSLIQVNTEQAIYIDGAIVIACHEGYPGHHVYNALLEQRLVKGRGWMEFCVYPLYSPPSLIAEGSANYGIEMAFPEKERIEFEKSTLWPLAGLDTSQIEKYYAVLSLTSKLDYATNEAARNYIDGKFTKAEAVEWLKEYSLLSDDRAERMFSFIEHYRSYVINYNLGLDIVRSYIAKKTGTKADSERWKTFEFLISTPQTPGELLK